jgi:UDP-glucose 4-epimerase
MSNILITGASGLLGSSLVEKLSAESHDLYCISRKNKFLSNNIHPISVDLSSDFDIQKLPNEVDVIYHLAQSDHFREFPNKAMDVFDVNIRSTAKLLNYARVAGVKKFIYASSGGVYGKSEDPFHENSPINPPGDLGYYLGSKACSEILVQSYASIFNVIVVRPFFLYGHNQKDKMLIPRLIANVINRKVVVLQGDNGIRINPIHCSDAAIALSKLLNYNTNSTFNIAGLNNFTIMEICNFIGSINSITPVFKFEESVPDLVADISLMKKHLHVPQNNLLDFISDATI